MRFLLIVAIAISAFISRAQTVNIFKGKPFKTTMMQNLDIAAGSDETGIYFIRNKADFVKEFFIIQKTNFDREVVFQTEFDFVHPVYKGSPSCMILDLKIASGKLLLFTRVFKRKSQILLMHEFDRLTGRETGEVKVIDEIEDENYDFTNFVVNFSPDESKMLITLERSKDSIHYATAKLYETGEFKKLWEKRPITIYKNSSLKSYNYIANNDGTLYYLFHYVRSKNNKDITKGLGMIEPNENQSQIYEVPCNGITLMNTRLTLLDNKLICFGEYVEGEYIEKRDYNTSRNGFFLVTLNPKDLVVINKSYEFIPGNIAQKLNYSFSKECSANASEKTYAHLALTLVNGCVYVVKEHQYYNKAWAYSAYRELLVLKYTKEYKLDWIRLIPHNTAKYAQDKIFAFTTAGIACVPGNKLHFVYYENPKNILADSSMQNYDADKYLLAKKRKSSTLVCTTIDDKGNLKRQVIQKGGTWMLLKENYEKLFVPERKIFIASNYLSKTGRSYDFISIIE